MFDAARSPNVFRPKRGDEAQKMFFGTDDAILFAGGTHVMARYPDVFKRKPKNDEKSKKGAAGYRDIIDLRECEAGRVTGNLDYFEIDANARLSSLLQEDSLPSLISQSLQERIPYSVLQVACLGGTVCPSGIIYDLSTALVALSSGVEIAHIENGGIEKEKASLESLCADANASDGRLMILRIFVPRQDDSGIISFCRSSGNPYFCPEESIFIAGECFNFNYANGDLIDRASLAVCYADCGCAVFYDTALAMRCDASQYVSSSGFARIGKAFELELERVFPKDRRNFKARLLFDSVLEQIRSVVF